MRNQIKSVGKNWKRVLQVYLSFLWRFIVISFVANIITGLFCGLAYIVDSDQVHPLIMAVVYILALLITITAGLLAMRGALKSIYSDFKITFISTESEDYEVSLIDRLKTGI